MSSGFDYPLGLPQPQLHKRYLDSVAKGRPSGWWQKVTVRQASELGQAQCTKCGALLSKERHLNRHNKRVHSNWDPDAHELAKALSALGMARHRKSAQLEKHQERVQAARAKVQAVSPPIQALIQELALDSTDLNLLQQKLDELRERRKALAHDALQAQKRAQALV